MADDDDRRISAWYPIIGSGFATTPERIEELQKRALESEKLNKAAPARPFAKVLSENAKARVQDPKEETLSEKERKLRNLPKKGPHPNLAHPSQETTFGREDAEEKAIILKG